MQLNHKVVFVTGAAKGIGAAIAERFVEAGASVAVFDIDGPAANATAARLCGQGRALALAGDVADEEAVEAALDRATGELGPLDVLVNNAGIEVVARLADCTSAEWDRQVGVNLKGAFFCAKHAVRRMRDRGGAIVNISSVHAFVAYAANGAYDASKAGMLALTRALALEHGPDGIRVNAICPGYIDTPMMNDWLATLGDPEAAMREVLAAHPLGRIGKPRDVAEAALFLASDAASFISGATLVVDGAMTIGGR